MNLFSLDNAFNAAGHMGERVYNLRDSVTRMVETDGRDRRHMAMNYGGSSGIGGRCLGSKNYLNGSCCWRIGDIASVGGEVERA
jgi:hypothetical protein